MANFISNKLIYADTVGLLSPRPIKVYAVYFQPATAGHAATLSYHPEDPGNVISNTAKTVTGTISANTTLTSTGNLSNIYAAGALLRIKQTLGDRANLGKFLITTAGDNNAVVCSDASWPLTNESSIVYGIDALTRREFVTLLSQATTLKGEPWSIPGGIVLPNLSLTALGASGKVYIVTD